MAGMTTQTAATGAHHQALPSSAPPCWAFIALTNAASSCSTPSGSWGRVRKLGLTTHPHAHPGVDFVLFDWTNNMPCVERCTAQPCMCVGRSDLQMVVDSALALVDYQVERKRAGLPYLRHATFIGATPCSRVFPDQPCRPRWRYQRWHLPKPQQRHGVEACRQRQGVFHRRPRAARGCLPTGGQAAAAVVAGCVLLCLPTTAKHA